MFHFILIRASNCSLVRASCCSSESTSVNAVHSLSFILFFTISTSLSIEKREIKLGEGEGVHGGYVVLGHFSKSLKGSENTQKEVLSINDKKVFNFPKKPKSLILCSYFFFVV